MKATQQYSKIYPFADYANVVVRRLRRSIRRIGMPPGCKIM